MFHGPVGDIRCCKLWALVKVLFNTVWLHSQDRGKKKKKEVLRDNSVLMSLGVLSLVIETLIVLLFVCCICFVFYFESKRFQQQTKEDKVLQKRQYLLLLLSESQAKVSVFAHLWSKFYP